MRNLKLVLQYIGTNYLGWQIQPQGPTIQSTLQSVLSQILQEEIIILGSGRTDSGVHALGQVANFKTKHNIELSTLHRALNGMLPKDIAVISVEEMPLEFNAMKHARAKTYAYFILNSRQRYPMMMDYVWQLYDEFKLDLMAQALSLLIGNHDFAAFCASDSEVNSTVRQLLETKMEILPITASFQQLCKITGFKSENFTKTEGISNERDSEKILAFSFRGLGFLKHMIRNLMGTLVDVGRGKTSFEDFQRIFESRDRRQAGMTAPAKGLFLMGVDY